jgi:hypothetical protein
MNHANMSHDRDLPHNLPTSDHPTNTRPIWDRRANRDHPILGHPIPVRRAIRPTQGRCAIQGWHAIVQFRRVLRKSVRRSLCLLWKAGFSPI